MAYSIRQSDGNIVLVQDAVINRDYSCSLLGEDVPDYGAAVAQSMLQLVENYAADVPPNLNLNVNYVSGGTYVDPVIGQTWYDKANRVLRVYDADFIALGFANGWAPVTSNISEVVSSIFPNTTASYDLGTTTKRWHGIYSTHGDFSTTGHVADVLPALTVTGNALFSGSTIKTNVSGGSSIGETTKPFADLYINRIVFGASNTVKLTLAGDDGAAIAPSTTNLVSLGSATYKFKKGVFVTTDTEKLQCVSGTVKLTTSNNLLPETTNVSDLGSTSLQFKTTNSLEYKENGVLLSTKYVAYDALVGITLGNGKSYKTVKSDGVTSVNCMNVNSSNVLSVGDAGVSINIIGSSVKINGNNLPTPDVNGNLVLINNGALKSFDNTGASAHNLIKLDSSNIVQVGNSSQKVNITSQSGDFNNVTFGGTALPVVILNIIYPIGTIYENAVDIRNPSDIFNWSSSTWATYGEGRVLVGEVTGTVSGDPLNTGSVGGRADSNMPPHTHPIGKLAEVGAEDWSLRNYGFDTTNTSSTGGNATGSAGDGSNMDNYPPYIVAKRWRRIT